jgi:hypothetical protein
MTSTKSYLFIKRLDDLTITMDVEINSRFENAVSSIVLFDHEQKSIGVCMNENPSTVLAIS